jgi:predicted metalloprotease
VAIRAAPPRRVRRGRQSGQDARHPGGVRGRTYGRGETFGGPGFEVRNVLLRFVVAFLTLTFLFGGLSIRVEAVASPDSRYARSISYAQAEDGADGAAEAAREFSRLEAERDFNALYDLMHPDARAVVPRTAVVGWYEAFFVNRETGELTVNEVVFEPWTWGVTGDEYEDAVTVRYVQPFWVDGVYSDVPGEVHLVQSDEGWGWFFGASADFVAEQVALYGDDGSATAFALVQENQQGVEEAPLSREERFPDPLHAHIDIFWEARFLEAGVPYDSPSGVVAFDEPIVTACGRADPDQEAAFYCVIDENIYYSSEFRALIEQEIGDFAWVIVVAHEWGHHIQATLGFDLGVVADSSRTPPPIEFEQQADCLAGAYAIDAEMTGWLDAGDIEEALFITEISGDPPGTAWNDPRAHGSSEERIDAFLEGYGGGITACDLDLAQAAA